MSNYRIPFAWGNTKFRDHLQYGIGNVVPKLFVNPDFTFANIMTLVWAIKTFTVTASVSSTGTFEDQAHTVYNYTIPNTSFSGTWTREWEDGFSVFHNVVDEQHLFGDPVHTIYGTPYSIQDQGFPSLNITSGLYGFLGGVINTSLYGPPRVNWSAGDNSLWVDVIGPSNPPLGLGPCDMGVQVASAPIPVTGGTTQVTLIASNIVPTPAGPTFGSFSFSMVGYTASGSLQGETHADGSSGFVILTQTNLGTFTVEATEYFPFQDSQGNPIYDTSTGVQLRDPFD